MDAQVDDARLDMDNDLLQILLHGLAFNGACHLFKQLRQLKKGVRLVAELIDELTVLRDKLNKLLGRGG